VQSATVTGDTGHPSAARTRNPARRWLILAARVLLIGGLGYVALLIALSNSAELSGARTYLDRVRWDWIVPALVAEALSYVAFTQLQRRLLSAGALRTRFVPILGITLAGNAMNGSLPGGGAMATVFAYRQFRRRGADEALTTWTIVAFTALASLTLAVLAAIGLVVAGDDGPVSGLWPLIALLIVGPVVGVAILLRPTLVGVVATPALRWSRRLTSFPHANADAIVGRLIARLDAVTPRLSDWAVGLAWAMTNWLTDCACLVLAFQAVGAHVPWRGLLVAYGAAQVATNVPITPGGLGVVEGSLTIALVAYGGSTAGSVAAVLLYRIISFWILLPLGWLAWLGLHLDTRRHPDPVPGIIAEAEAEG
jgi:putative heme transporter